MSVRTEFEVVPTGTAWEVKRNGEDFLAVQTREVAVDEAVLQATRSAPSHVVVKRLDGSIEEEASFGDAPAPVSRLQSLGTLVVDDQPRRDDTGQAAS